MVGDRRVRDWDARVWLGTVGLELVKWVVGREVVVVVGGGVVCLG